MNMINCKNTQQSKINKILKSEKQYGNLPLHRAYKSVKHNTEILLEKDFENKVLYYLREVELNYKQQVAYQYGIIDILTDEHIIEVKNILNKSSLHNAIGQLLMADFYFPNRKLWIVYQVKEHINKQVIYNMLNIELISKDDLCL